MPDGLAVTAQAGGAEVARQAVGQLQLRLVVEGEGAFEYHQTLVIAGVGIDQGAPFVVTEGLAPLGEGVQ